MRDNGTANGHGAGHGGHDDGAIPHRDPAIVTFDEMELLRDSQNEIDDVKITEAGAPRVSLDGAIGPLTAWDQAIPFPHIYKLNFWAAFRAGIIANLFFTAIWYTLYFAYHSASLDICLVYGSFIYPQADDIARLLGIGIHIGSGIAMAYTYAFLLLALRTQSKIEKGVFFGVAINFAFLVLILPLLVGFAPFFGAHAFFGEPDMGLNRVGDSSRGWEPSLIALAANMLSGAFLGGLYRHKVVGTEANIGQHYYNANALIK